MPSLGADMDAGRVSKWLVKPGDAVRRGDIVAVVETEKSTIEVEIFDTGVIEALLVPEGDEVPVGTVLARVASTPASTLPGAATTAPAPQPAVAPEVRWAPARRQARPARPERVAGRPKRERSAASAAVTSPVVRHLADTLGVDISTVVGTGRGGVVTRSDVERARVTTGETEPAAVLAPGPTARRRVRPRPGIARRVRAPRGGGGGRRATGSRGAIATGERSRSPPEHGNGPSPCPLQQARRPGRRPRRSRRLRRVRPPIVLPVSGGRSATSWPAPRRRSPITT